MIYLTYLQVQIKTNETKRQAITVQDYYGRGKA
jgi:hypothetical protein